MKELPEAGHFFLYAVNFHLFFLAASRFRILASNASYSYLWVPDSNHVIMIQEFDKSYHRHTCSPNDNQGERQNQADLCFDVVLQFIVLAR